jgi:hypothetical protein
MKVTKPMKSGKPDPKKAAPKASMKVEPPKKSKASEKKNKDSEPDNSDMEMKPEKSSPAFVPEAGDLFGGLVSAFSSGSTSSKASRALVAVKKESSEKQSEKPSATEAMQYILPIF